MSMYPIEQLFFGLITGSVLSWAATYMYLGSKTKTKCDDSDDSNDDSNSGDDDHEHTSSEEPLVTTMIIPNLPGKSLVVFHIPDQMLSSAKRIADILSKESVDTNGDEVETLFEEEVAIRSKSDDILEKGRRVGKAPISYPVSVGGGYMTLQQMEETKKANDTFKENRLTRSEELELMRAFRKIIGKSYVDAQEDVQKENYTLHPLYVGAGPKMPASIYSGTTIGVRISDAKFDYSSMTPSSSAIVTEIIDVGGVDERNIGQINL